MSSDFVIIGDTEDYKDCLVCVTAAKTYEEAEKRLESMLTNPTENDKKLMERHNNFRIEEIERENCWWND